MANNEIAKTVGVISVLCTVIGVVITLLFHTLVIGSEFGTLKAKEEATAIQSNENKNEWQAMKPVVQYQGWRIDSIVHVMH